MKTKFSGILTLLLAFVVQITFAQEKTISGVVSDENGLPLPSATVVIKGTSSGSSTDFDGNYSITANQGDVLQFSYVGYANKEITIAASTNINVSLEPDNTLEEVVVTALGVKRKKDEVTSSYEVVKTEALTQAANPNAVQALTGKVSGLQINTTSSGVDPTTSIVLRGNRTISGNNEALIVIDNAISSATVLSQIPPSLIESMTVLKGAQGAALYGSVGVNGAIIVTTRNAEGEGKTKITISSSIDIESIAFIPDRQTTYGQGWVDQNFVDYGDGLDPSSLVPWENGSWGPSYNEERYAGKSYPVGLPQANGEFIYTDFAPKEDNIKEFFKTGTVSQHNVTIEQGGQGGNLALSIGNLTKDFILEGDEFSRSNILFKAAKKVGNFSLNGRVNYSYTKKSQASQGLYEQLLQTSTNTPITLFENSGNAHHWTSYYRNPYWLRKNQRFDSSNQYVNIAGSLDYKVNDNISVSVRPNIQLRASNSQSYSNGTNDASVSYKDAFDKINLKWIKSSDHTYSSLGGNDITSSYKNGNTVFTDVYNDILINFNYDLSEDFTFNAILGNNIRDTKLQSIQQGGTNLEVEGWYHIKNVLNPAEPSSLANYVTRVRNVAGFANIDLGFKDYLFLNLTGRYESNSKIDDSFFYPSAGLSFSPLKAFSSLKGNFLSSAKLYGNYLVVGSAAPVGFGATTGSGTGTSIPFGFPFGNIQSTVGSVFTTATDIKPEFVSTLEFGGNFSFLKNRISLDASYYIQTTNDLITSATLSPATGLAAQTDNIGNLENVGYEIDLGLTPFKSKNFEWTINTSYSTNKTKIKSLLDGQNSRILQFSPGAAIASIVAEVGEEFPLIKGSTYERDPNGNIIVDSNGVPIVNNTHTKIGKATPDYILGLNTSIRYKGFKLGTTMDYRTGHQFYSQVKRTLTFNGLSTETASFDRNNGVIVEGSVQNTGTAANPIYTPNTNPAWYQSNPVVSPSSYDSTENFYQNSYLNVGENMVIDATSFKIREVSLSYTLSEKMLKTLPFSSLTFGINARNIFNSFSDENENFSDPESTSGRTQGIAPQSRYPFTKSIGASVNLTF